VTYRLKEIFYTLQGEGSHVGRPSVFARFSSCNLWTGRESERRRAICQFCDTDFVGSDGPGGGRFDTADALADAIAAEGFATFELPSGAGHDGMAMVDIADVAMIFIRCRGGISHHPDEHVELGDADAGARVLLRVIENFRAGEGADRVP